MRLLAIAVLSAASMMMPCLSEASAQSIVVRVTSAESGTPLAGAFVSLIDQNGVVVRSALTNPSGESIFAVSRPGAFVVKAEMIGRASLRSSPFAVGVEEATQIVLPLPLHAIALAEIRVDAGERCRIRPDEAPEIARVWEAARTPLEVQAWTERQGIYRLDISTYERDLDRTATRVERENRRGKTRVTRTPFVSLPPDELLRTGFVRPLADGGYQYYGPDAALLLSDEFLDAHCFRVSRSREQPGSIGLAFEPVSNAGAPDIQGTLWLDEQTSHLRFLEYEYTWSPYEEARGVAGGRVEFETLPNGAWIIGKWWIRAPIMVRDVAMARAGDSGIRVAGIRETGGEVIGVSDLARQRITQAKRGSLTGTVWDSTRASPLVGASVILSGTAHVATTDDAGRFVLEQLPEGVFTVSFIHARLDSLGIEAPKIEQQVTIGSPVDIALAIPSSGTIRLAACRNARQDSAGAALSGVVRDRLRGEPIPGATVRVEWQEIARAQPALQATDRWLEVRADEDGRYMACGIPIGEAVRVHASFLTYAGDSSEMLFREEAYRNVDLVVPLPTGVAAGAGAVSNAAIEPGAQGIQGVLLDRESGAPVPNAEVTVRSLSGDIVGSSETNERGFFRIPAPAPGRLLLSAQALGYGALAGEVVDVSAGQLAVLEIRMARRALELEPLIVAAESRAFHLEMEGFYRRQMDGLGTFITPEVFEDRGPRRITDVLFGLPGTNVVESSGAAGGRAVYFRSGSRGSPESICWPMIYINRHLVSTGGFSSAGAEPTAIDEIATVPDVWAMEVYRTPAEIPAEFSGPNAGCGVIVLWTRRGGT